MEQRSRLLREWKLMHASSRGSRVMERTWIAKTTWKVKKSQKTLVYVDRSSSKINIIGPASFSKDQLYMYD